MRPCKIYLTSRFRYLLFFNLTLKTKTATAKMGGGLLGISKPPGPIIMIANGKQRTAMTSYLLHSSLPGARFCCAFYLPQQTVQKKTIFCWAKPVCFHFSSSNFNLQGPILITCGVTLRDMMYPLLLCGLCRWPKCYHVLNWFFLPKSIFWNLFELSVVEIT